MKDAQLSNTGAVVLIIFTSRIYNNMIKMVGKKRIIVRLIVSQPGRKASIGYNRNIKE
jgi:hypothetical protein